MTTEPSLAERMYPSMQPAPQNAAQRDSAVLPSAPSPGGNSTAQRTGEEPSLGEQPVVPDARPADSAGPLEPAQLSVDELVNAERSLADRLYGDGSIRPDSPDGYQQPLGAGFDALEQGARADQNQADIEALREGRTQTAALLHELQVPTEEAKEITRVLGDWHGREPLTEDQRWDAKADTLDVLQAEWGKEATARIKLAQEVATEACKRMPWLADLLASGAGNDPALVKRFAEIGLRQKRRAKR